MILGLGWPELTALGALMGLGLTVLTARKDTTGVALGLSFAAMGALLAWGTSGGQSLATWVLIQLRFATSRVIGRDRWLRPVTDGTTSQAGRLREHVDLPGELGRIHLLETTLHEDGTGPRIGIFHDRRADTYTASLLVRSTSNFGLLGHTDQDRRLADWGAALEELARDDSPIRRVAWIERTLPEPTDGLADYLHQHRDPQLALDLSPVRSYLELLDQAGQTTDQHELLVVVQISGRAARRGRRGHGWGKQEAALRSIAAELDLCAHALQGAGLDVRKPLSAAALVATVRIGLDPWSRQIIQRLLAPDTTDDEDDEPYDQRTTGEAAMAGAGRVERWDHVLWDGSQHITMWVSRWPRQPVRSMFLAPLLMRSETTRAVCVVMEILGPDRGLRQAETSVSDDESNDALRWRGGMRTKRAVAKREAANRDREDELADGHIDIRWAGFVSVATPGTDPTHRQRAVDRVKAQASRCGMRLEVMSGQQADALTFVLPFARGLR